VSIFSASSESQDVELLLGKVADGLRAWEGGRAPALDLSIMLGEAGRLGQRAARLKGQWNLDGGAVVQSSRPRMGPGIIRFQHLVRRLTGWYLEPILLQIRGFQMNSALVVDGLAQNQERLLAQAEQQAAELNALRARVEALEAQLKASPER
jgi:hypothetical protein